MIRPRGFQKFAWTLNARVAYFVPHSFLFAILLTFTAYFLGVLVTYQGPFDMVKSWVLGVWNLVSFSMQMVLMVAAGFSVASAPVGQKILRFLAAVFRTPRNGAMFLTALTALCSLLHWGLGIMTGAFLARKMGRRIPRADYPLLVACAFIGMGAGNLGILAPDPLAIRRAGYFLKNPPASSGLAAIFSSWVSSAASGVTFPTLLYFHAVVMNLFAPTSGSVWEIQGPLLVKAAEGLNASLPRAIQALSAGGPWGTLSTPSGPYP